MKVLLRIEDTSHTSEQVKRLRARGDVTLQELLEDTDVCLSQKMLRGGTATVRYV
jgi:hypothetical protein